MDAPLVVVGASLAGLRAVEAARRAGFDGRVVLVGAEQHLPYDRPPLSKAWLDPGPDPEPTTFRAEGELTELHVELRLGTRATGLDLEARAVLLGDERLPYSALVIATGAQARRLPGDELTGVHALRTVDDARAVRAALDAGARTVVVGAGFIGSEVASAARARGRDVTVVEAGPAPLLRAVGPHAAPLCAALHLAAGVDLRVGTGVEALEAEHGRVVAVRLSDGERLPADLVVVGIGATPAVEWLHGSGLPLDDGVVCDATLHAGAGVFSAGDVARFPHPSYGTLRLEHWTSAAEQGALAGANAVAWLAGEPRRDHTAVPYFWSDVYGAKLQMVGVAGPETEVIGGPDGPWLVLYGDGERLLGALSRDLPGRIMKFRALLARGAGLAEARELATSRPLPVPA